MKRIFNISLLIAGVLSVVSCDKDYPDITSDSGFNGVFVLNKAGTVSFYDEIDSTVTKDIYTSVNGGAIGKTLNAFSIVGDRGYLLKGEGSWQEIELINANTFKSEKNVDGFSHLTDLELISDEFVYVAKKDANEANSGSVLVLDSINLTTKVELKVGKNPTRIEYSRGKRAYVANTGSAAYPDSTIMVIDVTTKEVIDTIAIEQKIDETTTKKLKAPVEVVIDAFQNIWVLCVGLDNEGAGIAKIDYGSHDVKVFDFDYEGPGRNGLIISNGGRTIYFINNGTYAMGIDDEALPTDKFFKGENKDMVFNVIGINPAGKFFCAKDGADNSNGSVYIFDRYGYNTKNVKFEVGVMPRQLLFVRD